MLFFKRFFLYISFNYIISYYDIPANEVHRLINAIDNDKIVYDIFEILPFISKELRTLVEIPDPVELKQKIKVIEDKFEKQTEDIENMFKQHIEDKLEQQTQIIENRLKQHMEDKLEQQTENIENRLKQRMEDKLEQQTENIKRHIIDMENKLEQQMKNTQELLDSFIKNYKDKNDEINND